MAPSWSMLRYIIEELLQGRQGAANRRHKCFILLHFGSLRQRRATALMQRTKIPLTGPRPLPRMKLLRCTNEPDPIAMTPIANPLSEIGRTAIATASKAARISVDSAERTLAVQLEYAKGAIKQATVTAQAVAQVKDVQELFALRVKIAENAIENFMGYSRSLYEVASEAQAEYSRLAEERMGAFQQAVSESVDKAAQSAPAGSDVAVAAIKSQLAAATAAFDSFTKASRHVASFTDAGLAASRPSKSRK